MQNSLRKWQNEILVASVLSGFGGHDDADARRANLLMWDEAPWLWMHAECAAIGVEAGDVDVLLVKVC